MGAVLHYFEWALHGLPFVVLAGILVTMRPCMESCVQSHAISRCFQARSEGACTTPRLTSCDESQRWQTSSLTTLASLSLVAAARPNPARISCVPLTPCFRGPCTSQRVQWMLVRGLPQTAKGPELAADASAEKKPTKERALGRSTHPLWRRCSRAQAAARQLHCETEYPTRLPYSTILACHRIVSGSTSGLGLC